jgi:hypothetical protein
MNDNLKYDGLCNPINQLLFDSVTTFIETVTSIDINGKIKPLNSNGKDIIFLPTDLGKRPESITRLRTLHQHVRRQNAKGFRRNVRE